MAQAGGLGVIGLGNMGIGMAARLAASGYAPRGFDLSDQRREMAEGAGIRIAGSLDDAVAGCGLVMLSLPDASSVERACRACIAHAADEAVVVDCSTIPVMAARAMARMMAHAGRAYIDAPVSGGPSGAEAGTLTMMIGGEAAVVERVRPMLAAIASRIVHVGGSGAGQVAKLANNALLAAHMVAGAEAMRMVRAAGVDPRAVLDVINAASGRSNATEVNLPRWVMSGAFDSGFTAGLMRKDVGLALDLVAATNVAAPVLERAAATWLLRSEGAVANDADFNRVLAWVMEGGDG